MAGSQLTAGQRELIAMLHSKHYSYEKIRRDVGCSKATVSKWVARIKKGLGIDRKARVVKKKLVSEAAAVRATELLQSKCEGGARFVAAKLRQEGCVARVPSRQTVVRAAKAHAEALGDPLKYVWGRPKKGLTPSNRKQRVAFCTANRARDWSNVMITDRCKFHFRYPGSKVFGGRWVSESTQDQQGVYTPNHPQCSNVYGGITRYGATKLIPVTGTSQLKTSFFTKGGQPSRNITSDEYRSVLRSGLLPAGTALFGAKCKKSWVLQQDGDPTHGIANSVVEKFNRQGCSKVQILPNWPGNSPDLSPIENVWAYVDRKVAEQGCTTFSGFKREVNKTFQNLPKRMLENLFASLRTRMDQCIEAEGGKIKY